MTDLVLPLDVVRDAAISAVTKVTRRAEILEADGTTVWHADPGIIGGSVSVDNARSERRSLSITFDNTDGSLRSGPGEFWYDKIIRVYRGIDTGATQWERLQGEFFVDTINEKRFPKHVTVSARDRTKILIKSKFAATTSFPDNEPLENILEAIAFGGGVPLDRINLPLTGVSTNREYVFDASTERWSAMKEMATAYEFDLYFNNEGVLVMDPFSDPALDIPDYVFQTGTPFGNLVEYEKVSNDSRLFNHVIVVGQLEGNVEIRGEYMNTDPLSPTNVSQLGVRTAPEYKSSFIATVEQANSLAESLVHRYSLESFELNLDAVVIPWMEAGIVAQFIDPDPDVGDPTTFLLSSFDIPLDLKPMSVNAKRILPRTI